MKKSIKTIGLDPNKLARHGTAPAWKINSSSNQMRRLLHQLILLSLPLCAAEPSLPEKIEFNRDVRPILSDNCFYCHGNDSGHRKAKLRLDIREAALKKDAFVPGDPDQSDLIERIFTDDEEELMPPPDSHKKLTAQQKQILKRWIAQGAEYQQHWSYNMPQKATIPAGKNAVDTLVKQRITELGLKPSPEADRRTLIRRLYSDLLGLPPKPEEVAAFINDSAPDAYEQLVGRVLKSPHYGERMAIGWLDVVRFADTIGYHSDNSRNIWPYRDWVIKSFNDNKRFDRFTIEQIAGDLMPDANQETRIGSAFNRLLLSTEEGGAQAKDYEQRMLTDRVRAVSAAWMGQTIGCAQCHDHKFDPITSRDFYTLGAFFADIEEPILGPREPGMMILDEQAQQSLAAMTQKITDLKADFAKPRPELAAGQSAWEQSTLAEITKAKWTAVTLASATAARSDVSIKTEADGLARATTDAKPTDVPDTYKLTAKAPARGITGFRLTAVKDKSPGIGLSPNGNFVLTEITVTAGNHRKLDIAKATATYEQPDYAAATAIDGISTGQDNGWAVQEGAASDQSLQFELAAPFDGEKEDLTFTLTFAFGSNHQITNPRIEFTTAPAPAALPEDRPAPPILAIIQTAPGQRTPGQITQLADAYRLIVPELAALRTEIAAAEKTKADFEASAPKCLVTVSQTNHRIVRILPRGDWMNETGEIVKAALPHYLPGPDFGDRIPNRLDLAQWLVSKENPLTARTVMNRLWKQFFGIGLSKVLDDLGAQGEPPPNQALLDWLACEFIDSGWDMKHMVRSIVTSSTYKQVSSATPEQLAADPLNRHVARQSPFRLQAELVRDNALATAGLLVQKIGGPSVKPYQPDGYWENLNFPQRGYDADQGENQYRRGLYVWWQRSFLHPSMLAFDAPSREECTAERNSSNIPQQALALLNDPSYVEAARAFAARILTECPGDTAARLQWAWQQVLQRAPLEAELKTIAPLLDERLAAYRADGTSAEALLKVGLLPAPATLDKAELAAWTHVARVLLNLHETITRS
jgi:hypothetical protein